jgi:dTDP-4-dehydrorhamnose 3,5-epimerase
MTESTQIEGVIVQSLKQIADYRGSVLHMMRNDSELLIQFGEIYFSEIYSGKIKAWKRHKKKTQNLTVPISKIRLVIFDNRSWSRTHGNIVEYELGRPDHYKLIHIPPMLWYGFQALGDETALIANCPDQPYDSEDSESLPSDSNEIPYQWKL